MPYISVEDETLHERMDAVAPSTNVEDGWQLAATLPQGDPVAQTTLAAGEGFNGTLNMTIGRHPDSVGDTTMKLFYQYLDENDNVLTSDISESFVSGTMADGVVVTGGDGSIDVAPAPANTVKCVIGVASDMAPVGDPIRTNLYPDPRTTSLTNWSEGLANWDLSLETSFTTPVTGMNTCVKMTCNASETTNARRASIYQSVIETNPVANKGLPIDEGVTYTASLWVRSSLANTITLSARCFSGTTWSDSAVTTSVSASAGAWTPISVTFTAPAGSEYLAMSISTTSSNTYSNGSTFRYTGVMVEESATANTYFDGTTTNGMSGSVRWDDATNKSVSYLYSSAVPGGTTIMPTESTFLLNVAVEDVLGTALERDLRRSVAEIWSSGASLITSGKAGLLMGRITYLCTSLAQAKGVDAAYQLSGLLTLNSEDEINGLRHRAIGVNRISNESTLNARRPKWILEVEFREQER